VVRVGCPDPLKEPPERQQQDFSKIGVDRRQGNKWYDQVIVIGSRQVEPTTATGYRGKQFVRLRI
jgi:hypothetical protein